MRPTPVCRFFDGTYESCRNGEACPFSHDLPTQNTYAQPSYGHSYQKKSSWTAAYDPSKYKYVAPKKEEEILKKITRTISNEEKKEVEPERTPSPKPVVLNKEEDLSSIYSNHDDLSIIDRDAFAAPSFTMGMIPVVAPSRDFC
ncbi:hypothetical protein PFISCL1PPCAC_24054 [Pristionchus fissidentatus]|uniref:Nucleoporin NUP42 n=1 Tax=Pristionchus fissidentatus TaxID=1538716 RepID=A0AAV5WSP3_9BILA|nr:hypothetical protein PFISCL1PPCAC_24054 [Pristionchus fissidentatus]